MATTTWQSTLNLFKEKKEVSPAKDTRREPEDQAGDPSYKTKIICTQCRGLITFREAAREVAGKNEHTFSNPYGILFHVSCFQMAPGCLATGKTSGDFSWFPGHRWQVAICRGCQVHNGWRFVSGEGQFFALITDKITEADSE